jgi:hypothetical protein
VVLEGLDEAVLALQGMASRVQAATPAAIKAGQALVEDEARAALSRYSHERGTPTPAPPGGPPALVTGRLRSSFEVAGPTQSGAGVWMSVMGPTTPYARIQELGGRAGRHGSVELPARPYLRPAAEAVLRSGRLTDLFVQAWTKAIAI